MSSRFLGDLHPCVYNKAVDFLRRLQEKGYDCIVTSTYRSAEEQNVLYTKGRTSPGSIVTGVRGGNSFHQYRVAFDVVPLNLGKPQWNTHDLKGKMLPEWQAVKEAAAEVGLEWAGNWKRFKEYAHLQFTGGLTINDFKAGKTLP